MILFHVRLLKCNYDRWHLNLTNIYSKLATTWGSVCRINPIPVCIEQITVDCTLHKSGDLAFFLKNLPIWYIFSYFTVSTMIAWCFRQRYCTAKAILDRRQPEPMRWILIWIMPLAQKRSLELLASSPSRYHCTTDAPYNIPT